MRLLITGAAGFIGAYVVREAVARGHAVLALSRSPRPGGAVDGPQVEWLHCDLARPGTLDLNGRGIDAVIHLAAEMRGRAARRRDATLAATCHLLAAMNRAGIRRLVGVSSIAVLDYLRTPAMARIDEGVAAAPDGRWLGPYAAMKLAQEKLLLAFADQPGRQCVLLRPGLVYDEEHLIAAHAGIVKGALRLLTRHRGDVPTVEAGGLARAIVNAAERDIPGRAVIHLVDDNLPSQQEYLAGLRRRNLLAAGGLALPWQLLAGPGRLLKWPLGWAGRWIGVPDALMPNSMAARFKPFHFANDKAKRLLGWIPENQFH